MKNKCPERWRAFGLIAKDQRAAQLFDLLLLGPFCLWTGILLPFLPINVRAAFITAGSIVMIWNGYQIWTEDK